LLLFLSLTEENYPKRKKEKKRKIRNWMNHSQNIRSNNFFCFVMMAEVSLSSNGRKERE